MLQSDRWIGNCIRPSNAVCHVFGMPWNPRSAPTGMIWFVIENWFVCSIVKFLLAGQRSVGYRRQWSVSFVSGRHGPRLLRSNLNWRFQWPRSEPDVWGSLRARLIGYFCLELRVFRSNTPIPIVYVGYRSAGIESRLLSFGVAIDFVLPGGNWEYIWNRKPITRYTCLWATYTGYAVRVDCLYAALIAWKLDCAEFDDAVGFYFFLLINICIPFMSYDFFFFQYRSPTHWHDTNNAHHSCFLVYYIKRSAA